MGIFNKKPKVDTESFCNDYYDSQMFHAVVNGEDGTQKILDSSFQQLLDSEASFRKIDRSLFEHEMTAMHLELFSLAFYRRYSFDKAVQQSIFTLNYLQEKNRIDIWDSIGEYSKVVAQTATMKANGLQMTGDSGIERMTSVSMENISVINIIIDTDVATRKRSKRRSGRR